jgi:hypothetical protein
MARQLIGNRIEKTVDDDGDTGPKKGVRYI